MKKYALLITFIVLSACSSKKQLPVSNTNQFTDTRDYHVYKTVKIGKQVWMAENLNYAMDGSIWPDYKEDNGKIYGRLYNFDMLLKGAIPKGWHLPSNAEWQQMLDACPNPVETLNIVYAGEFGTGKFHGVGEMASFYTSTQDGYPIITRNVGKGGSQFNTNRQGIGWMLSVRCVKDAYSIENIAN